MTSLDGRPRGALVRRGFALEWATRGWNVAGIAVLAVGAITARSVALAGFGLDSLVYYAAREVLEIFSLHEDSPAARQDLSC